MELVLKESQAKILRALMITGDVKAVSMSTPFGIATMRRVDDADPEDVVGNVRVVINLPD